MRIPFIATLLSLLFAAGAALAHAQLERATPSVGGSVSSAPREVVLQFSEKLEPAFSTVSVRDAAGARVDRGNARASGNTLRVSLDALKPGSYRVSWRVVSVDTHATRGDYSFRVGQ
jgi:methionine-rich copper-binding protein CopC